MNKEEIIENLTQEQEDILQSNFAEEGDYMGCDDDMPDAFDNWLEGLEVDKLIGRMKE